MKIWDSVYISYVVSFSGWWYCTRWQGFGLVMTVLNMSEGGVAARNTLTIINNYRNYTTQNGHPTTTTKTSPVKTYH